MEKNLLNKIIKKIGSTGIQLNLGKIQKTINDRRIVSSKFEHGSIVVERINPDVITIHAYNDEYRNILDTFSFISML